MSHQNTPLVLNWQSSEQENLKCLTQLVGFLGGIQMIFWSGSNVKTTEQQLENPIETTIDVIF